MFVLRFFFWGSSGLRGFRASRTFRVGGVLGNFVCYRVSRGLEAFGFRVLRGKRRGDQGSGLGEV